MSELPTGTVTFLFTDLEGSTRLWEQHPEAMPGALARHDGILRRAVEAHNGYVVKTTGDGIHAVFVGAGAAAEAAAEAQRRLASEPWGETGALRVRMGLHTGIAEQRAGDYFGTTLNRAARLMAVAHGGQIVCSAATADLCQEDTIEVDLVDLGDHRLRDLSRPERVFQVRASGLDSTFPALRSIDSYPGVLPSQLSTFVGRSRELVAVPEALQQARLVTLIGVGGVGKTRLAAQVAGEVLPRFPDGAWFCELAASRDGVTLVESVAATVGARPRPDVSPEGSLVEYLRAKTLLLVLDNCEHLLTEIGGLADAILRGCPAVRVLATSREPLGIDGEQLLPVRSLGLPAGDDLTAAEASDALCLFENRGAASRPGFRLDESNLAVSVEICRRLDGIPLAIELAAARLAAMSPSEISGYLDERFRLLTGGRRLGVERHQTLRAAVDWSYALLGADERTIFDRAGVFAGSFGAPAITALAEGTGIESWDVLDALMSLVSKSMLTADEVADGSTRYQLLETLRQYALERLDESGFLDDCRRLHAAHYAFFAEEAGSGLLGPDELRWRPRMRADLDNLRAAVTWGIDSGREVDLEFAARIVSALASQASGDRAAGIAGWAQRLLPAVEAIRPDLRAGILGAASFDAAFRLDYDRSLELSIAAMDWVVDHPEAGQTSGLGGALGSASLVLMYTGRLDEALALVDRWTAVLEDVPEPAALPLTSLTAVRPMAELLAGDIANATRHAEEVLRVARDSGNPSAIALAAYVLGWALMYEDPAAALRAFDESSELPATWCDRYGPRTQPHPLRDPARRYPGIGQHSSIFAMP